MDIVKSLGLVSEDDLSIRAIALHEAVRRANALNEPTHTVKLAIRYEKFLRTGRE